jgi:hypothetical protein
LAASWAWTITVKLSWSWEFQEGLFSYQGSITKHAQPHIWLTKKEACTGLARFYVKCEAFTRIDYAKPLNLLTCLFKLFTFIPSLKFAQLDFVFSNFFSHFIFRQLLGLAFLNFVQVVIASKPSKHVDKYSLFLLYFVCNVTFI